LCLYYNQINYFLTKVIYDIVIDVIKFLGNYSKVYIFDLRAECYFFMFRFLYYHNEKMI